MTVDASFVVGDVECRPENRAAAFVLKQLFHENKSQNKQKPTYPVLLCQFLMHLFHVSNHVIAATGIVFAVSNSASLFQHD